MKLNPTYLLAGTLALLGSNAYADPPAVVTSIKPVHALVAGVMQGVGTPSLIIEGAGSPHTYSLRPSKARALQNADVIFWIGSGLETFLDRPIDSLGEDAHVVSLMEAHGLSHVAFREGGPFEGHAHDDHGDDDHDAHGHDDDHEKDEHAEHGHDDDHEKDEHAGHGHDDDHEKDEHAGHGHDDDHEKDEHAGHGHDDDHGKDEHAEQGHDDHGGYGRDAHIWLDPMNAKAMTHEIAEVLGAADPANAARYEANAEALEARIDGLTAELRQTLEPVHERPFIVFHDAYQHFERRFDLNAAGSITVSPEVIPGAERVSDIRHKVEELGATCVFSEPQFTPRLVKVVTDGTAAKSGVLDPLGAGIPNGPDLYFMLMRDMAASMRACLSPTG